MPGNRRPSWSSSYSGAEGLSPSSSSTKKMSTTESTPLLCPTSPILAGSMHTLDSATELRRPRHLRHTVTLILVLVVILQMADQLMEAPTTRIFESIYCYEYYEVHDPSKLLMPRATIGPGAVGGVKEELCKVAEVQSAVAALEGNQLFWTGIPSLVLAIPFGILADRWGRKPIMFMGSFGLLLAAGWIRLICWFWQTFNLRLTWLSALGGVIGGGPTVLTAVFLTVLSDVVAEEARATVFFQISASSLLADFLATPMTASLMAISPWVPMFVGLSIQLLGTFLVMLLPETLHHHRASMAELKRTESKQSNSSAASSISSRLSTEEEDREGAWHAPLGHMARLVTNDWRVPALMATFLVHVYILSPVRQVMMQYASTRYHISFSRATLMVSLRAGLTCAMYLGVMPLAAYVLVSRWGYSGKKKDLHLMRGSAILASVGWCFVGVAPSVGFFIFAMTVLTLGSGFATLVRSFVTGLVGPQDVAKLFTLMSVLDTVGMMAASPLFAWIFKKGMGLGGVWLGLPFWCLGACNAVFAVLAFMMHTGEGGRDEVVVLEEEEEEEVDVVATV